MKWRLKVKSAKTTESPSRNSLRWAALKARGWDTARGETQQRMGGHDCEGAQQVVEVEAVGAQAQFNTGSSYCCEQDYERAAEWWQRAAVQGHAEAQSKLGNLYHRGQGVEQDNEKAAELYQRAAVQGMAEAQLKLGELYHRGEGVEQDHRRAAELFQQAADQGMADAQYSLGVHYSDGKGVKRDRRRAAELYQQAADRGFAIAQRHLGDLYRVGDGVEKEERRAAELYQQATDQGDVYAQCSLGDMYYSGQGVDRDYCRAFKLYQQAAEQGHADAQKKLGLLYHRGQGVEQDYGRAAELLQLAAEQGTAGAQYSLGLMYYHAQGVAQDYSKAVELLQLAVGQGHAEAQSRLGIWHRQATADQGKANKQYDFALPHGSVEQDSLRTAKLFQQVADQGTEEDHERLTRTAKRVCLSAEVTQPPPAPLTTTQRSGANLSMSKRLKASSWEAEKKLLVFYYGPDRKNEYARCTHCGFEGVVKTVYLRHTQGLCSTLAAASSQETPFDRKALLRAFRPADGWREMVHSEPVSSNGSEQTTQHSPAPNETMEEEFPSEIIDDMDGEQLNEVLQVLEGGRDANAIDLLQVESTEEFDQQWNEVLHALECGTDVNAIDTNSDSQVGVGSSSAYSMVALVEANDEHDRRGEWGEFCNGCIRSERMIPSLTIALTFGMLIWVAAKVVASSTFKFTIDIDVDPMIFLGPVVVLSTCALFAKLSSMYHSNEEDQEHVTQLWALALIPAAIGNFTFLYLSFPDAVLHLQESVMSISGAYDNTLWQVIGSLFVISAVVLWMNPTLLNVQLEGSPGIRSEDLTACRVKAASITRRWVYLFVPVVGVISASRSDYLMVFLTMLTVVSFIVYPLGHSGCMMLWHSMTFILGPMRRVYAASTGVPVAPGTAPIVALVGLIFHDSVAEMVPGLMCMMGVVYAFEPYRPKLVVTIVSIVCTLCVYAKIVILRQLFERTHED